MKFIHTADWHLGQKLIHQHREEEHDQFLNWLLDLIQSEKVELLVIAGDIFDTGNPPHFALKQYFNFLTNLQETTCRNVVIVGGNHDSVNNLSNAKKLLEKLNIFVIGGASDNLADDIFPIYDEKNQISVVVCAIPFLREKDLREYSENISEKEKSQSIRDGIAAHYEKMANLVLPYKEKGIPIIATGHFFMSDIEKNDEGEGEREIYIGNLKNIDTKILPDIFDYVALGHIHKAQKIGGKNHIRYSGSPIPLSFSERNYRHVVLLVELEKSNLPMVNAIEVPIYRKLIRFEGSLAQIEEKIKNYEDTLQTTSWLECVIIREENIISDISTYLDNFIKEHEKNLELFKVEKKKVEQQNEEVKFEDIDLADTDSPKIIFAKLLETKPFKDYAIEEKELLVSTFEELLSEINQTIA